MAAFSKENVLNKYLNSQVKQDNHQWKACLYNYVLDPF